MAGGFLLMVLDCKLSNVDSSKSRVGYLSEHSSIMCSWSCSCSGTEHRASFGTKADWSRSQVDADAELLTPFLVMSSLVSNDAVSVAEIFKSTLR